MNSQGKRTGGSYRSTHKIANIDYSRTEKYPDGYLECLCGWIGRAYDKQRGELEFGDEKDWPSHKKTAIPIESAHVAKYKGRYGPQKKKEAA